MNESQGTGQPLWYTRRAGTIRGPYTTEHISRYVLLGRIRLTDELSQNRDDWHPVIECSGILPEECSGLSNWEDYQKLILARAGIDERRQQRRRNRRASGLPDDLADRRRGPDRRKADSNIDFLLKGLPGRESGTGKQHQASTMRALMLLALLLSVLVAWFGTTFR